MNKEKFWKILAIVSCSLLVIVALCSFSVNATSKDYDICKCLEDIESELHNIKYEMTVLSNYAGSIKADFDKLLLYP